jgi:hypothetical protein
MFPETPPQRTAQQKGHYRGSQNSGKVPFSVYQRANHRQYHGDAGNQKQRAKYMKNRKKMHEISLTD